MTDDERKALRAMAGARLAGGERPDDTRAQIARYLMAQGWKPNPAKVRAREVVSFVERSTS